MISVPPCFYKPALCASTAVIPVPPCFYKPALCAPTAVIPLPPCFYKPALCASTAVISVPPCFYKPAPVRLYRCDSLAALLLQARPVRLYRCDFRAALLLQARPVRLYRCDFPCRPPSTSQGLCASTAVIYGYRTCCLSIVHYQGKRLYSMKIDVTQFINNRDPVAGDRAKQGWRVLSTRHMGDTGRHERNTVCPR